MNIRNIVVVYLTLLGMGCANASNDPVIPVFKRITNDRDSASNMYVVYEDRIDSSHKQMKFYWNNGAIQAVSYYKNGKREGEWTQYDENGNISFIGNFTKVQNKENTRSSFLMERFR
ncbi:toxin-antitoxin system YwqK family antitoxin [Filimonas effusa]|uniref:Toxin-antitoxin system YwqK family antitoxin n=1 Tax=Filimonas effusa TaxID=2508721 RepID=A0A4Q1D123_9BACT|nr:hypothetical protein [Filimonas effusa]RXK81429.1 hypothetical protein ESB13_21080 [Filimonas effusa]